VLSLLLLEYVTKLGARPGLPTVWSHLFINFAYTVVSKLIFQNFLEIFNSSIFKIAIMSTAVENFLASPTVNSVKKLKKAELLEVAKTLELTEVTNSMKRN